MFSKISRYRKLPDEVTVDAAGRRLPSKGFRELPKVSGSFRHTVEEADRLDQLAYKYYQQPRKWWRICDANPEFPAPQALLGKGPVVTVRIPLSTDDGVDPPWAELLPALRGMIGVEDVRVSDELGLVAEPLTIGGETIEIFRERPERALTVTCNRMNIDAVALCRLIEGVAAGLKTAQPETIGRVGKTIVIPPDAIG